MVLALLVAASLADVATDPSLAEQWLSPATLDRIVQLGGLTLLAILFARGAIITRGQHESRVADLVKYADAEKTASDANHDRELKQMATHHLEMKAEMDRRFDGMKESRDSWRDVARQQTTRADQATTQLLEANELAGLAIQQMEAVETAARAVAPPRKGAEVVT